MQIKLIHPEDYGSVFRLPLFPVRIAVFHAQPLHDRAAFRIVSIMRGGDEFHSASFCPLYNRKAGRCDDSPASELRQQTVAEIKRTGGAKMNISYGDIVLFQADGVGVSLLFAAAYGAQRADHFL